MRIYIAGPYTGDEENNVLRACRIGARLMALGHTPFVPHLNHYIDQVEHFEYEDWMRWCLTWLRQCEGLYYIAPSPGADRELWAAVLHGLVIYRSLEEVKNGPSEEA